MASIETTIDDLPNEILYELLKYLNLPDLINCRLTNKRWKSISDITKVRQLIISDRIDEFKDLWFDNSKRPINYKDAVSFDTFRSYIRLFNLKQNLLELHVNYVIYSKMMGKWILEFDLSIFNGFVHLRELDLRFENIPVNEQTSLNLPNLIRFKLELIKMCKSSVDLIAPKLEHLYCDLNVIDVRHPESIRRFTSIRICDDSSFDFHKITKMKNLEFLLIDSSFHRYRSFKDLSNLPNLKELHLDLFDLSIDYHREDIKDDLLYFLRQKLIFGRDELTIWLLGVELTNEEMLEQYFSNSEMDHVNFQIKHYGDLFNNNVSDFYDAHYNKLIGLFGGQIPVDYISKFSCIRSVYVKDQVTNQQHLIWFLSGLNYLQELCLNNTSFNQSFYDDLHAVCRLSELFVFESNPELSIDFKFVLKFKLLTHFETNQSSEQLFDLAISSFNNLKHLMQFEFKNEKDDVRIKRNYGSENFDFKYRLHSGEFEQFNGGLFFKTKIDLKQLIIFYNQLKDNDGVYTQNIAQLLSTSRRGSPYFLN